MDPRLIAALIHNLALPELLSWLHSRQQAGTPLTDADVLAKLQLDADNGIAIGEAWLAQHPRPI